MNARSLSFRLSIIALSAIASCIGATAQSKQDCAAQISHVAAQEFPGFKVVSSNDLEKDLRDYLRETKYLAEPGCLTGDFNGDGLNDYVVLIRGGRTGAQDERLVVFTGVEDGRFTTVTLDHFTERAESFYVVPVLRKSKTAKSVERIPSFKLILFESASRLYYWNGRKFAAQQLSD